MDACFNQLARLGAGTCQRALLAGTAGAGDDAGTMARLGDGRPCHAIMTERHRASIKHCYCSRLAKHSLSLQLDL